MTTQAIWHTPPSLTEVNRRLEGTLGQTLSMAITDIGPDHLTGTMPVDERTFQTFQLLHGGASVALAETLGSIAANLVVDRDRQRCVGQEINANHVRGMRRGVVTGTARPLHLGRSSHVWDIRIVDESGRLVCVSRLTMAVLAAP
jgi:1,4-dihydroxy-2-naphthoyl-CoA hydrolase